MNVARRSEGLLPASGFVELWMLVREGRRTPEAVAEAMSIRRVGTSTRTLNSLALLEEMRLVASSGGIVLAAHTDWTLATARDGLRQEILKHYCHLLQSATLGPAFQHDPGSGELQVNSVLLPYRDLCFPYLLIEFGLFVRSSGRPLAVAPDAASTILDALASINSRSLRSRSMSPAQLEAWLAARREAGEVAEAFAMEFELRRLSGHCMLDQLRWVSLEDVGAGFDILSFDDERSLLLDRSIEVKGYRGERRFHWSTDEIAAARTKREKYWLYLVDRDRVSEPGYEPDMLNDPYSYLIEVNPAGWLREPTSYMLTAPVPEP